MRLLNHSKVPGRGCWKGTAMSCRWARGVQKLLCPNYPGLGLDHQPVVPRPSVLQLDEGILELLISVSRCLGAWLWCESSMSSLQCIFGSL